MTVAGKIRILLVLIVAFLIIAVILVKRNYTPVDKLVETGKTLESNLQVKERYVAGVLNNINSFERLKHLPENTTESLNLIENFTAGKTIWFITLKNGNLLFWSGIKVIPDHPADIREGHSFIKEPNGYYEAIKKTEGDFSAIFFIPVKIDYAFQNQYLRNEFLDDLVNDSNVELTGVNTPNTFRVHSIDRSYLFSIRINQQDNDQQLFYYQLGLSLLIFISLSILVNNICSYVADKGHLAVSAIILALFLVLVRFVNIHFHLPGLAQKFSIFDPAFYKSSAINPSVGDLFINVMFTCWFTFFLYKQRLRILRNTPGKVLSYLIFLGGLFIFLFALTALQNLFYDLVINSKHSFDVSNVLNLSFFSLTGMAMLCFSFLTIYLLIEIFLTVSLRFSIPGAAKIILFIAGVLLATLVISRYQGFTVIYILSGIFVLVRAYAYRYHSGRLESGSFVVIIFSYAVVSSVMLNHFESVKEEQQRREVIEKLAMSEDQTAGIYFKKIERQIIADTSLTGYFKNSGRNIEYIKTRLQKLYFNGYSSKYEFSVYEYNQDAQPLFPEHDYPLSTFSDMVIYNSSRVSTYFFKDNESFGLRNYVALLPITQKDKKIGTIVITLKARVLQSFASFPDLVIDDQSRLNDDSKGYSYAFYVDDKLLNQSGNYIYDIENHRFNGKLDRYVYQTTRDNGSSWYDGFSSYSHLLYKPGARNLVIVTKKENPVFDVLASVTFYFVVFLLFSLLFILSRWLWGRIRILTVSNNRIVWKVKIIPGLVLYKTRIQFSMIFAVVVTLVAVGYITFYLINTQYQAQQDETIKYNLVRIASAFKTSYKDSTFTSEESQVNFNEFANKYSSDLTLFDKDGVEILTTQPKIYHFGLLARRINARAFIYLTRLKRSIFVNNETIGKLKYKACYVPVQISAKKTIAYLQLPYFSNEAEHTERMGALLNIMINVYVFIFIAIGLFAIFVARQITAPLNFIQNSLSRTTYGKKNEPIKWDRNDEIGALITEYNKMIAALENSAQKLAQSERESAWREMAKQVAHEIKNPLTPLKLGLQLLDKSWKDKDPKFDQKFERFSKSFVEQIESLSSIASEFSAFAKMPDTRIERLNIFDVLIQVVTIFKEMDNIKILYQPPEAPFYINGDRDQLLRCFNNLLKNAIEATPADRQGVIEINYLITAKSTLLTVKDNGNGIPENLREKIFEPNFTTKSSGTGLGLAFVKNSIENAGGKVWFETILGEGTTFYFSLPAA